MSIGLEPAIAPPIVDSERLSQSLERAKKKMLSIQNPAGYWVGELQGDSILESEFILLNFILGHENDPDLRKIANYLRSLQCEDGGWNLFPGGPADLSGTVKAYFALKLMGDDPQSPHMLKAKEIILARGGAEKCNSFTKFYFAALGQISFDACPAIPPEIIFLPKWFYFNLYNVSAWTRTMILPLAFVTTLRFTRKIDPALGIPELYIDKAAANRVADPPRGWPTTWRQFFLLADQIVRWYQRHPFGPLRRWATRDGRDWLLRRMSNSEGLGAIFPPMVYMLIVMRAWGWPDDHPRVVRAWKELKDFYIEEDDTIRLQPCFSPVWDTSLGLHALADAGLPSESDAARRGVRWLLDRECREPSDWQMNCPDVEPSGWFFEFQNPHYPDVDDTTITLAVLRRLGGAVAEGALRRGLKWMLAMQNSDGGWAAFDKTKSRPILEEIPFADHNAVQDPSCPDIAGRVLEGLGHCGLTTDHPAVQRAIVFLQKTQDINGGWWGRWGVNYIYGTWQVLAGLKSVGNDMGQPFIQRAARWLASVQKPDGSFGETAQSYEDPTLIGQGPSTASQTAWGAMGLLAVRGAQDSCVQRAIAWLIDNQAADGNWEEKWYTGTGFPKVFYLKYHLYRLYFPLRALPLYRNAAAAL